MTPAGFPHSDISGSKLVCSSPKLFAACHVLHRLSVPRHPPFTLSSLTKLNLNLKLVFCLSFVLRRILSLLDSISCQRSEECRAYALDSKERQCLAAAFGTDIPWNARICQKNLVRYRPGGADRDRTDDLRLAKPALSQLSYSPSRVSVGGIRRLHCSWWA